LFGRALFGRALCHRWHFVIVPCFAIDGKPSANGRATNRHDVTTGRLIADAFYPVGLTCGQITSLRIAAPLVMGAAIRDHWRRDRWAGRNGEAWA
jgi:hypothetical protein